jgi:hypothetical protein
VLANSSKPGSLGVFTLKNWRRINAWPKAFARMHPNEFLCKRTKTRTNHHVIVLAARVPRNATNSRHPAIRTTIRIPICNTENAPRSRNESRRVKPLLYFFGKVTHATLLAVSNPRAVRVRMRCWACVRDSSECEPMFVATLKNRLGALKRR